MMKEKCSNSAGKNVFRGVAIKLKKKKILCPPPFFFSFETKHGILLVCKTNR